MYDQLIFGWVQMPAEGGHEMFDGRLGQSDKGELQLVYKELVGAAVGYEGVR